MVGFIGKFQGLLFPIGGLKSTRTARCAAVSPADFEADFRIPDRSPSFSALLVGGFSDAVASFFSVNFGSDGNEYCDRSGAFVGITVGYLQLFPLIFE